MLVCEFKARFGMHAHSKPRFAAARTNVARINPTRPLRSEPRLKQPSRMTAVTLNDISRYPYFAGDTHDIFASEIRARYARANVINFLNRSFARDRVFQTFAQIILNLFRTSACQFLAREMQIFHVAASNSRYNSRDSSTDSELRSIPVRLSSYRVCNSSASLLQVYVRNDVATRDGSLLSPGWRRWQAYRARGSCYNFGSWRLRRWMKSPSARARRE